jgi:AcrR family transcriptional regulator
MMLPPYLPGVKQGWNMPRKVDHDERRHYVLDIACRVIQQEGVDAATVRRVAAEAGCSTTIVSHYFANKRELLQLIYRRASEGAKRRVRNALAHDRGDVDACLEALLPMDDERFRDWHVWFAFWGMAIGDPEFAEEHRAYLRQAANILAGALQDRFGGDGRTQTYLHEGQRLFALVSGIAAQAVFDGEALPTGRLKELVADESDRLTRTYGDRVENTRQPTDL